MKHNTLALSLLSLLLLVLGLVAPAADAAGTPTWTESGPVNRAFHTAVLDTATKRMIIFGGSVYDNSNINPGTFASLNDVWRLNNPGGSGLTWTQVKPSGTPPVPRVGPTAVYDPGSNRMIVFGGALGNASPCANDVWVLTNANGNGGTPAWIQLSPVGAAPAPRYQHGAAYNPTTNTMIVFGGQDCFSTTFGDVWVLSNANGVSGTPTWTQLSPVGGGPGPREISNGVAYDATDHVLMVFGGSGLTCRCNDTWVLTNADGQGGMKLPRFRGQIPARRRLGDDHTPSRTRPG